MRHKALIPKVAILAAALVAAAAAESPAIERLRSDAELGDAVAQDKLGMLYAESRGVPLDYRIALWWLLCAAEQGYAEGQFNLGSMYYYGRGTPWHYPPALEWYRLAAEQGHAGARFKLGLMYAKGQVFPRSYREALTAWNYLRETADSPGRLAALLAVGAAWAGVVALPGLTYVIARRKRGASACRPPEREESEKG